MIKKLFVLLGFLFCVTSTYGDFVEVKFSRPEKKVLYQQLITELKCLVCQNQSLAESNAELAIQLKREIYNKVEAGWTKQQILSYVVARYGEFILLQPTFSLKNMALWFAPVIFLLFGLMLITRKLK